jgi:hypothetical protein
VWNGIVWSMGVRDLVECLELECLSEWKVWSQ